MDFTITVNDPVLLAGIAWAREQNGQLATDQEYIAWLMSQAFESYARDRKAAGVAAAIAEANEGDLTKLDAIRTELANKGGRLDAQ